MKKFQHIHIMILALLLGGVLFSVIFALTNLKEMSKLQGENTNFVSSLPVIKENPTPYTNDDYQKIIDLFNKNDKKSTFELVNKNNQLILTTSNIENEADIRGALMTLLALDKNLKIFSFCGKSNNSCNGSAFEIILKAEKVNAIVKNNNLPLI